MYNYTGQRTKIISKLCIGKKQDLSRSLLFVQSKVQTLSVYIIYFLRPVIPGYIILNHHLKQFRAHNFLKGYQIVFICFTVFKHVFFRSVPFSKHENELVSFLILFQIYLKNIKHDHVFSYPSQTACSKVQTHGEFCMFNPPSRHGIFFYFTCNGNIKIVKIKKLIKCYRKRRSKIYRAKPLGQVTLRDRVT